MKTQECVTQSALVWNAGSWWGSQMGASAWAFILGIVLLFADIPAAVVCLGAFAAFNCYGLHLWRRRDNLTAYGGIQRLLFAFTLLFAIVVVVLSVRGITESQTPFGTVPLQIPYRGIALPLVFIVWFFVWNRTIKRRSG